jgi:hypothetical protein
MLDTFDPADQCSVDSALEPEYTCHYLPSVGKRKFERTKSRNAGHPTKRQLRRRDFESRLHREPWTQAFWDAALAQSDVIPLLGSPGLGVTARRVRVFPAVMWTNGAR